MCIIQGEVSRVSNTKICVIPIGNDMQMTIYENKVKFGKTPVAMILPFPNGYSCRLVDLSRTSGLFKSFDKLFPTYFVQTLGYDSLSTFNMSNVRLEVKQVGSYKASIVPSLEAFDMLDSSVFSLRPDVKNLLETQYKENFGFVVCQMDVGAKFHPIGYVHMMVNNTLFIPTYHFHEKDPLENKDGIHDDGFYYVGFNKSKIRGNINHIDWDHSIYVFNADQRILKRDFEEKFSITVGYGQEVIQEYPFEHLDSEIERSGIRSVCKFSVTGIYQQNHDFIITVI